MNSKNAVESDIRRALAARIEPLLPADGWEDKVLAEMNRRRRRRALLLRAAVASVAAAAALVLVFMPAGSIAVDPDYIYSEAYYASLPRPERSISEDVSAIIGDEEPTVSLGDFYEPYTPLPL